MKFKDFYEKLAAYSLFPGLAVLSGLESYFGYKQVISPAVFTGNVFLDSLIQVFFALIFALLVSVFWLFPFFKYFEYREEEGSQ